MLGLGQHKGENRELAPQPGTTVAESAHVINLRPFPNQSRVTREMWFCTARSTP